MTTEEFINILHRGQPTAYSCFIDSASERKRYTDNKEKHPVLNVTNAQWSDVRQRLEKWAQENHGSIFMAANVVNGWRKQDNVTDVCAIVLDGDSIPKPDKWLVKPSAICQRSEDRWHAYWFLEKGQDKALYNRVAMAVSKLYHGDSMVAESSTLIRVPGTLNRKAEPEGPAIEHQIIYCEDRRYTLQQLVDGMSLRLVEEAQLRGGFDPDEVDCPDSEVENFRNRLVSMEPPAEGNRHGVMLRETLDARLSGMAKRTIFEVAAPVFESWGKHRPELRDMLGGSLDSKIKKGQVKGRDRARDVFSDTAKIPIVPFPSDILPKWASDYANDLAYNLDTEPDYAYLGTLACIAGMMPHTTIQARLDYCVHPNLYIVAVGAKGASKSPLVKRTMAPLVKFQKAIDTKYETDLTDYKTAMKIWKAAKGDAKGEEPEEPPEAITRLATDSTIEAVLVDMATNEKENDTSTLTWFPEEMTSMFRAFGKYSNSSDEMQYLLKAYDNTYIKKRRVGKGGNVVVSAPRLSVVGTIQPSVMSNDFQDKEDGFIDRWLFFYPKHRKSRDYNDRTISKDVEKAYYNGMAAVAKNDGLNVPFTDEGRSAAQEVVRKIEDLDEFYDVEASAKWKTHFYKFALLITVADLKSEVGVEEVRKAERLSQYAVSHWVRCWSAAQTTKTDLLQERLLDCLKGQEMGLTVRELSRTRFRKEGTEKVKMALNALTDDNLAKKKKKGKTEFFYAS